MIDRPPDIVINRKTKEVTNNRRLSDEARIDFLAPLLLREAIEEQHQKNNSGSKTAKPSRS